MFSDVKGNCDSMIVEIREFWNFISQNHPPVPTTIPRYLNTAKGLIYVQLYGVIENTILKAVSKTINYINNENENLSNLKPCIYSLILSSELDSLNNANKKKWDKRHNLFEKLNSGLFIQITDSLLPTDGKNIGEPQLSSIWKTFGLTEPIFDDLRFKGRLAEITTSRINIAHGNETASTIGKNVTIGELEVRINEVSTYCSYLISVFEDYISNRKYLK